MCDNLYGPYRVKSLCLPTPAVRGLSVAVVADTSGGVPVTPQEHSHYVPVDIIIMAFTESGF